MSTRENLLELMEKVQETLVRCRPIYAEYANAENSFKQLSRKRVWLLIIVGISIFWGCACANFLRGAMYDGELFYGHAVYSGRYFHSEALVYLLSFPLVAVTIIYSLKSFQKATAAIGQRESELEKILKQLDTVYQTSEIFGKFPQMYLHDDAVSYCRELIKNMRAESIKEAINIYEEHLHRMRIENMQSQHTKLLESIQKDTNQARKAAQFAAAFGGITAYHTAKIREELKE